MEKLDEISIAKEYLKCKMSVLYFVENYIKIPVPGGMVTQKESDIWNATAKYRQLVKMYESPHVDNINFMASRQHGKTTTVAQLILHSLIFYPGLKVEFLTLTKKNAEDVIERMKFMYDHLPYWLQIGFKGKGDYKTFIEFANGSKISTRYISGNISPDQIARGMSVPMLWIDEAAFIPHFEEAWTAAQPAIATARKFAKKNGYPTKIIMTTTPNGAGENFFYKIWTKSWDYEEIFDFEKNRPLPNANEIVNSSPEKNNFVRIKIHWSETGKDDKWYQQQIKELNFNMRKVNQELNLVFLGSATAIFDDDILTEFNPHPEFARIDIGYGNYFKIYEDLSEILENNKDEIFILGADTAVSTATSSDYSALSLIKGSTGEQIGEWHGKVSVLKRYAKIIKKLIRSLIDLYNLDEDNFKVIIERNSIGLSIIEEMIYDDEYDYSSFIYKTEIRKGEKSYGIATKKDTREKMFDLLLSLINESPSRAKGPLFQEELRNLEQRSTGRIEAARGSHDDIIMATNFCFFVRDELIKKGVISGNGEVKKFNKNIIKSDVMITFSTLESEKLDKELPYEVKFEYDEKSYKKKYKELQDTLRPKGVKYSDQEDIIGYDILAF